MPDHRALHHYAGLNSADALRAGGPVNVPGWQVAGMDPRARYVLTGDNTLTAA